MTVETLATDAEQLAADLAALTSAATLANTMHGLKDIPNDVRLDLQTQEAALVKAMTSLRTYIAGEAQQPPNAPPGSTSPTTGGLYLPPGYSASDLILDDKFTKLNTNVWNPSMGSGQYGIWPAGKSGSGLSTAGPPYNAAYFSPSQLSFGANGLAISAVRSTAVSGYSFESGCLSSYRLWALKSGYVEWLVWFPDMTTGAWPGLWLLDGLSSGHDSNPPSEQDAFEGGYSNLSGANPNNTFAANSHGAGNVQALVKTPSPLPGSWHVVGCEFIPGKSFKSYLDKNLMAAYTKNVTTDPLEIITNLQMAQGTQGWHPVVSSATPSVTTLQVAELVVYGEAA